MKYLGLGASEHNINAWKLITKPKLHEEASEYNNVKLDTRACDEGNNEMLNQVPRYGMHIQHCNDFTPLFSGLRAIKHVQQPFILNAITEANPRS